MANHIIRNLFISTLLILFAFLQSTAQSLGSEVGFGLGASIYQGDLSPHWIGAYNRPGFTFQLMAQKNLFPGFALRANFAHGSVSDNEENYTSGVHQQRNFSFEATINEFSAHLIVNPQFSNGMQEPGNLHPYFFGGVGIAYLNIKRDFSRFNHSFPHWQTWVLPGLAQDSMTVLPTSTVTFPVGFGLRYQIGDNVALYGEITKRITRTEYLDGFSKSANRQENDGFSSMVFGLAFRLFSGNDGSGSGQYSGNGGRGFRLFSGKGGRGRYDCPKNVY